MSYSSIFNVDTALRYTIKLNDEVVRKKVAPHHVDSVVYELECEGFNIVDEIWDEEAMEVQLISTGLLDEEEPET